MSINLDEIQSTIDYHFDNEDLLQQAFVRRSYSEEYGGQNNEVLEFIGDKALDLAVIRIMMERFGEITDAKPCKEFKLRNPKYFNTKLKEGQFTDIKKDLVQKKALARCVDDFGFQKFLFMGHGDRVNNIQEQDSVKEDLFEAILGAVAVDSDYNMDEITSVVKNMIDFDAYFENEENDNYVGMLQEWYQKNGYGLPDYKYSEGYEEYECYLTFDGHQEVGYGSSLSKARKDVAENMYNFLLENDYIVSDYELEVGEPDEEESLRQINELYQKGLISKPEYTFTKDYDEYGDTLWTCECSVDQCDYTYDYEASSKNEAKRIAAYQALCELMDYQNPYDYDEEENDYYD